MDEEDIRNIEQGHEVNIAEVFTPPVIDVSKMEFDTEEAAYLFYNEYGGKVGFSVRKEYANRHPVTGQVTSRCFVCSKEGLRGKRKREPKKRRAETRTNCGARMQIAYDRKKEKYFIKKFVESHNHPLLNEKIVHMMPSQRNISVAQSVDLELASDVGIPCRNAFDLMSSEIGGKELLGFTKRDQWNYLRTRRQREMQFGEKGWLMNYFQHQQSENPSFFYAVQLDIEEMITNIFWADPMMIIDYGHFGDVVTFDTTYRVNQGNRPFGMFAGLNHHRETVVFGAALMYDETADSFAWLFNTFLSAMSGKAPRTILTDQDAAMAKALSQVMGGSRHHLCVWHLMQNAAKHLFIIPRFDSEGDSIKNSLSKFFYCYEEEDEFLEKWDTMVTAFSVADNKWLSNLFSLRHKWAKAYVKNTWSGGMRTTQLGESLNGRLKEFIRRQLALPDFFKQFDTLLSHKRYKESEAEYGLLYKLPRITTPSPFLHHASKIYTTRIFEKLQNEFVKGCVNAYISDNTEHQNGSHVYTVGAHGEERKRRVTKSGDGQISCSCGKFEMEGILCSHALIVLKDVMRINELPSRYILTRWTKNAREGITEQDIRKDDVKANPSLEVRRRFRILTRFLTEISTLASKNEQIFNSIILEAMKWKENALIIISQTSADNAIAGNTLPSAEIRNNNEDSGRNSDQNRTLINAKGLRNNKKTKGKTCRIKPIVEKCMQKKKDNAKRQVQRLNGDSVSGLKYASGSNSIASHQPNVVRQVQTEYSWGVNEERYVPQSVLENPHMWPCLITHSFGSNITQPTTPLTNPVGLNPFMFSSELLNTPASYNESCVADLALDLNIGLPNSTPTSQMSTCQVNGRLRQRLF